MWLVLTIHLFRNFNLALERTLEGNCQCSISENETHYHIHTCIARECQNTRDKLQITARITLSIHAIFVNVKKNILFFSKI